jgi:hypothetical protein
MIFKTYKGVCFFFCSKKQSDLLADPPFRIREHENQVNANKAPVPLRLSSKLSLSNHRFATQSNPNQDNRWLEGCFYLATLVGSSCPGG